jgi:ribosomal protein S18 acetylase RimI-like enzyme
MRDVHPEDRVVLDVSESNIAAQRIYSGYNSQVDADAPTLYHGIFTGQHITMQTTAADL